MKRKMLISIALILIMLLNCISPLFVVNAAEDNEIVLNSKLYKAVKSSLEQQDIDFESNDITHKLIIDNISSITELNLNDGAISDLTGLEVFTGLTRLDLSGNNLNKESNLEVLNSLTSLNYLDLSTNQLDDVSSIASLIDNLKATGTIILSGQEVVKVEKAYIDESEDSDQTETAEFELPQILELAGFLKSNWKEVKSYNKIVNPAESYFNTPYVESMPMEVTSDSRNISIRIADENGNPYQGMVKVYIHVYDDQTEANKANNPNRAAENILNDSKFTFYYVVSGDTSEIITTMDTNLYKAIKEQLTGGQTVNRNLISYPYAIQSNGDIIYDEYTYEEKTNITEDTETIYHKLTNTVTHSAEYLYNTKTNQLYKYSSDTVRGELVNKKVEKIEKKTAGTDGVLKLQYVYRIAVENDSTGKTLYEAAYDDAKTFVIDDMILTNKITSLILNNKQIRDLSGLEYFIGLNQELNVSHNYLQNIDSIYELDTQKDAWEKELVELYVYWLRSREYGGNLSSSIEKINTQQSAIDEAVKNINTTITRIKEIIKEADALDTGAEKFNENVNAKAEEIKKLIDTINGYIDENGEKVKGYKDIIEEALNGNDEQKGINKEFSNVYTFLGNLYTIYNNEYKLTTLLIPTLNYQTNEEYKAYKEIKTTEQARAVLVEQINFIKTLESKNALSDLDKKLLKGVFSGLELTGTESTTPISDFFDKYLEDTPLNRTQIQDLYNKFIEMNLYSEMANYCLIKRMNEETQDQYCYQEEYLENRIKEFGYEGIPTELEEKVLNDIKGDETYTSTLYDAYEKYQKTNKTYGGTTVYTCKGPYKEVEKLSCNITEDQTLINAANKEQVKSALKKALGEMQIPNKIDFKEAIKDNNVGDTDELILYNQLISLASKLLSGDVDRYVKLPRLKVLDISYNAELDNIDRISQLKSLVDLNASYCYIANVSDIDWASMTKLRKLNLAYNYISDISALTTLPNLTDLNLSNNLIAGELQIDLNGCQELFKHLKDFDLSGNQITDISNIIMYLDNISNGDYANYLAREDTVNINLNNQVLEMIIEEPFYLSEYPTTVNVDLPKIFTQLLAIDTERTAFGTTSKLGRIESEGTYVVLSTETVGDKVAEVKVVPMTGNGQVVDTCIGNGTTLKIKYSVADNESSASISMTPSGSVSAKVGEKVSFTATVTGNVEDKSVEWTVKGNRSASTKISSNGELTIASDETADTLTVTATSVADRRATVSTKVTIEKENQPQPQEPTVTKVTITPSENVKGKVNGTVNFSAEVEGDEENQVTWSIEGNTSNNTKISAEGELTIGSDEQADTITVIATSKLNNGVVARVTVTIEKDSNPSAQTVIDPNNLGYVKDETYLKEVKPKTPIDAFKEKFLNGQNYEVVLTKEGSATPITSGYVQTGMFVKLLDENGENVVDEESNAIVYEIVVTGDSNGDGVANSLDSVLIKAHRNEVKSLTGACLEAADINKDEKVNVSDAKLLLYHRAEVKGYGLNYVEGE